MPPEFCLLVSTGDFICQGILYFRQGCVCLEETKWDRVCGRGNLSSGWVMGRSKDLDNFCRLEG